MEFVKSEMPTDIGEYIVIGSMTGALQVAHFDGHDWYNPCGEHLITVYAWLRGCPIEDLTHKHMEISNES